jgi:hypothetical protein
MHREPTTVPAAKWLHQAIQYHYLLPIVFLFHQDYDDHHLFLLLVVKYEEDKIAIANYDPLLNSPNSIIMKVLIRIWFHDVQWGMGHGFKDLMI